MQKLKLAVIAFVIASAGLVMLAPDNAAAVVNVVDEIQSGADDVGASGEASLGERVQQVVNILLYILGAIAVVMIVIGGIRYATSNGDSGSIKSAKDTILYSVIGLVVAILAYAIVNFVLDSFK